MHYFTLLLETELKHVVEKCPFERVCIQTDNGSEFTNSMNNKEPKPSLFEKTLEELGIQHKRIKPYTPRHNGKVGAVTEKTMKNSMPAIPSIPLLTIKSSWPYSSVNTTVSP